ncbi:MAG: DUF1598 domain-containing protein [Saprospiraceae bacterium]|nr:DUF1598 domain-containing protein [Saprospiraceae bacterium]
MKHPYLKIIATSFTLLFLGICFLSNTSTNVNQVVGQGEEEYLCISLSRLINAESFTTTKTAPPGMDTLFGMSLLEGYILDPENHDIILFGKRDPSRRPLNFFDVLINFQSVFGNSYQAPYCSLDPLPENMKKLEEVFHSKYDSYQDQFDAANSAIGGQQVVVGGVPNYSNHAFIMIYADYQMKAVSQGYIKIPGIRSLIEIYKSIPDKEVSLSSRFWFHIKKPEGAVSYPNFTYDSGIVKIQDCPVIILTEKQQMDSKGNLTDKNAESDPVSEAFAAEFSNNFSQAVLLNSKFCELENLYRLHALFLAMKYQGAIKESNFDVSPFFRLQLVPNKGLPKELPGLVNADLIQNTNSTIFTIVAGGVSMDMNISDNNLTNQTFLKEPRKIILEGRKNELPVYWLASF